MSRTLSSIWRLSCGDICPSSSEANRLAAACLASSISLRLAMISLLRALARFSCGGEFHSSGCVISEPDLIPILAELSID